MIKGVIYMLSAYPACFYRENEGYSVVFPDLNDLATCGDTLQDALKMAIDCLAGYLYSAKIDSEPVPVPSDVKAIVFDEDYERLEHFVNIVTVDVDEYAKIHFQKAVKKTLTIPKWLNDYAITEKINFSKTLQNALIAELNLSKDNHINRI